MAHGQTCGPTSTGATGPACAAGDRYLVVYPFFHIFGYKAGHPRVLMRGATHLPQRGVRRRTVLERIVERERITCCPGRRPLYQIAPRPPRPRDPRHLVAAPRGHRCGRHPGRAHPAHARGAAFETHHHRLRPHREPATSRQCRSDDDPETIATTSGGAMARLRGARRRRGGRPVAVGEPGEVIVRGVHRDARLLRRPRGHRGGVRCRGLAAHRRRRRVRRATATCASSAASRTCSSWGLQRLPGRDREPAAGPPGGSRRRRSSASPTSAWARWAWRSWCRAPGVSPQRGRARRAGARRDGQLQGAAAASSSSTRCR